MPCLHLLISGKVQGVWFRESMCQEALKLGVSGWVRNLPDGRVEAIAFGDANAIEMLVVWCKKGPPLAKVDGIEILECEQMHVSGRNTGFEKR